MDLCRERRLCRSVGIDKNQETVRTLIPTNKRIGRKYTKASLF
ncbi:hypothetical protein [Anaerosolibacter carboniphilus]|nr:hypothetical protein [Anaerosolibacter carboniphilus]